MALTDRFLSAAIEQNNQRVHAAAAATSNPVDIRDVGWHWDLAGVFPDIRGEWSRASEDGLHLPRIGDVLAEDQGQIGTWRVGLLVADGRDVEPLATSFPVTVAAVRRIPGLRSALWSVLEPGTELPEHSGPNAGVLRYHLGVDCGPDAALRVGRRVVTMTDGSGVLFDDTEPHAAWNRGPMDRVTLFCELDRPLPTSARLPNLLLQRIVSRDPRYRRAARRASEWHRATHPA